MSSSISSSSPKAVPVSFKKVAVSLCACAVVVALLNLYMNLIATYGTPSLQLDLSPDGDVIGFHQFDIDHGGINDAGGRKSKKLLDGGNLSSARVRTLDSFSHEFVDKTKSDAPGVRKLCPGLCPPSRLWPKTQSEFVKTLVERRMRNLPKNSFLVETNAQQKLQTRTDTGRARNVVVFSKVWRKLSQVVSARSVLPANFSDEELKIVIRAVSEAKIVSATVPKKGTQLKAALLLQGNQIALFKPQRYLRNHSVPTDTPYSGADRHNAEIAAFHLSRIFGMDRVPIAVGRRLKLREELFARAEMKLKKTFLTKSNKLCFYGECLYCNPADSVCEDSRGYLEGAVILILPPPYDKLSRIRSPWARTYDDSKSAPWQSQLDYCNSVMGHEVFGKAPIFLDLMDMAVFDWLTGNADRHRLETVDFVGGASRKGAVVLLDNGKAFGNAQLDEITILAPVYQCCKVRRRLYRALIRFSELNAGSILDDKMKIDPIYPILSPEHLEGINRRIRKVIVLISACIEQHGESYVLQDDGF